MITAKCFTNNLSIFSFSHTESPAISMKDMAVDDGCSNTLLFHPPSKCTNVFKLQKTRVQRTTSNHVLVQTTGNHTHRQLMLSLL